MSYKDWEDLKDCVEVLEKFVDTLKPRNTAYYSIAYIVAHLGRKEVEKWGQRWDE